MEAGRQSEAPIDTYRIIRRHDKEDSSHRLLAVTALLNVSILFKHFVA